MNICRWTTSTSYYLWEQEAKYDAVGACTFSTTKRVQNSIFCWEYTILVCICGFLCWNKGGTILKNSCIFLGISAFFIFLIQRRQCLNPIPLHHFQWTTVIWDSFILHISKQCLLLQYLSPGTTSVMSTFNTCWYIHGRECRRIREICMFQIKTEWLLLHVFGWPHDNWRINYKSGYTRYI